MYLTELKTFKEEDRSIRWIESSTELIKVSESMAKMLFQQGWAIYFRESNHERLYHRSWWGYIKDEMGHDKPHQFPNNYPEYFVKKIAITDDSDNI
ncbi:MAG TPA: hypothetical protein V6C58_09020 [Allocoleopsis sp.]